MHSYHVYIMASKSGTLYIGVSGNLFKRVWEHKNDIFEGFTKRYSCKKLIYFEETNDVHIAIKREKQLKGWKRVRKEILISSMNATWVDLSKDWY